MKRDAEILSQANKQTNLELDADGTKFMCPCHVTCHMDVFYFGI